MADSFYHFKTMVTELLVIWVVGVVSFFVLWAVLLKVIKRISEKKEKQKELSCQEENDKQIPST